MTLYKQQRRTQAYRSPAIHIAARRFRGDPGIFDSIWSGIKGAAGGFLTGGIGGAILGGAAGIASGNKGKPVNPSVTGSTGLLGALQQQRAAALSMPGDTRIFSPGGDVSVGLPPMIADPGRGNVTQGGTSGTDWNDSANSLQRACQKGYHANKTGYWTKKYGYIPKGSNCVKNRRRNPLNPRAASRAMARLSSAKSASKFLGRISIRPSHGCGCK
jgi:hypothetical protein